MIDIKQYKPGRFAYLMGTPFAGDLWNFLTAPDHIQAMENAIAEGKPAIEPLLLEIEERFADDLASKQYHEDDACVLVNNMIKQLLELLDYRHIACGACPQARFIRHSGIYGKKPASKQSVQEGKQKLSFQQ